MAHQKKKNKRKLSAEERKQRQREGQFSRLVNSIFTNVGMLRCRSLESKNFRYPDDLGSDFDLVYVFENLVFFVECTTSKSENVPDHLRKKIFLHEKIASCKEETFEVLRSLDEGVVSKLLDKYHLDEIVLVPIYCSLESFDSKARDQAKWTKFFDYAELRYFKSLSDCIKNSAFHELMAFFEIDGVQIGSNGKMPNGSESKILDATLLPEANSNFEAGFKVVSFYADAGLLLDRAYVLRREGWMSSENLYQRFVSKTKIEAIRKHLRAKHRVFVNNIIVTLDGSTKVVDENGNTVCPDKIKKIEYVKIQLPNRFNSIGLIDGQHRTYSYYRSTPDDLEIAKLRNKQNLLVTGLIYPEGFSKRQREAFEAQLFLEINSNQANASSALKLAISRIVRPFSEESIAHSVLEGLAKGSGPLKGHVAMRWFDKDKLKTTSIIKYGLRPLVKASGDDSLFSIWTNIKKHEMVGSNDESLRDDYVKFCVHSIDQFLIALKISAPPGLWVADKKVVGHILNTTLVNGFLVCMRRLVENGLTGNSEYYADFLSEIDFSLFKKYKSSQYGRLGNDLANRYFGITSSSSETLSA